MQTKHEAACQQLAEAHDAHHEQAQQLQLQQSKNQCLQAELADMQRIVASHAFKVSNASSALQHMVPERISELERKPEPPQEEPVNARGSKAAGKACSECPTETEPDGRLQVACAASRAASVAVLERLVHASDRQQAGLVLARWHWWTLQRQLDRSHLELENACNERDGQSANARLAAVRFVQRSWAVATFKLLRSAFKSWTKSTRQVCMHQAALHSRHAFGPREHKRWCFTKTILHNESSH